MIDAYFKVACINYPEYIAYVGSIQLNNVADDKQINGVNVAIVTYLTSLGVSYS